MVELELEVGIVELVHPDVSVLATAGVAPSGGVEHDRVDGTEVTLHPSELLVEHHVEEPGVELADPGGGGGHVHGVLTSAQHDVVEQRADGGRVHGTLGLVAFQFLQIMGIPQQRGLVLQYKSDV